MINSSVRCNEFSRYVTIFYGNCRT